MMKYADHHGFPIVTFIDTPGAYADLDSEAKGQVCCELGSKILWLYFVIWLINFLIFIPAG